MKISYSWLKTYLPINLPVDKVAEVLTDIGLEVEGVEEVDSVPGGLRGLVIGEVIKCGKHPNADKLSVTEVNIGEDENLPIVCGAPNVQVGQKVVVATVGSTIHPINGEPFKIKKAKIRGEVSQGMICAEDEIGLGSDHDGIMVLDPKVEVGTQASVYFELESDQIIEIGLTPNRADAMSHYGVARDLAVGLKELELIDESTLVELPTFSFKVDNEKLTIPVEVHNKEACPRYCSVTISNVAVKESPDWLKNRLKSIGLNPHNNVVDITNFILHDMGQPLHAFDADQIAGKQVNVKMLPSGTKFKSLDEEERKLHEHDLIICDESKGMCIAGVFGGINSGVTDQTTNVFLESAYFNPTSVRKTAKRHGLNTDASFRFERGIDPNITMQALQRAAALIKEVAGGEISSNANDTNPETIPPFKVSFDVERACRLIGKRIPNQEIKAIFERLEMSVNNDNEEVWEVLVPPYRVDVTREADLVEDILRIYGYNEVAIPSKLVSSVSHNEALSYPELRAALSKVMLGLGFSESMSNSLASKEVMSKIEGFDEQTFVDVENPLSNELNILRPNLMYHALEAVRYNLNRKQSDLKLFELGKSYLQKEGYEETELMSFTQVGNQNEASWNSKELPTDLYAVRGIIDAILNRFNLENKIEVRALEFPAFDYGLGFYLGEKKLAYVGKISDQTCSLFDIDVPVFFGEVNLKVLLKKVAKLKVEVSPLPKFPAVTRDLALLIDKEVTYQKVRETIIGSDKKLLQSVNLFDVYQGKNLPDGKKSYAVSMMFQDSKATLKDEVIEKLMNKIITRLQNELKATLR